VTPQTKIDPSAFDPPINPLSDHFRGFLPTQTALCGLSSACAFCRPTEFHTSRTSVRLCGLGDAYFANLSTFNTVDPWIHLSTPLLKHHQKIEDGIPAALCNLTCYNACGECVFARYSNGSPNWGNTRQ
jgi:hypothetical protein